MPAILLPDFCGLTAAAIARAHGALLQGVLQNVARNLDVLPDFCGLTAAAIARAHGALLQGYSKTWQETWMCCQAFAA